MSVEARLNKLMAALTAKERAILVLGSMKDGSPEDPSWRTTMPTSQVDEFNRLISLMNGANVELGSFISYAALLVDAVELRHAWLMSLFLWEGQVTELRRAVRLAVKEPISRRDYERQVEASWDEWVPVDELAALLAGDHDGWTEADYEEVEDWDQPVVTAEAWYRVCREKAQELRRLVAEGKLEGRTNHRRLQIKQGEFDDYFGRTSAPAPERVLFYRVLDSEDEDELEWEPTGLPRLYEALEWWPLKARSDPGALRPVEVLAAGLRTSLASAFGDCWATVRAIELVLDEVSGEFEGIDPLRPVKREVLEGMKQKLVRLGPQLACLEVDVQTPEPDETMLDLVRRLARLD